MGSWEVFPLVAKVNLADTGCVMAAGLSAPAGEEEAAGGLCSAPEGEGAARGALHLLWAWEDPAGASTGGEQVGGEQHGSGRFLKLTCVFNWGNVLFSKYSNEHNKKKRFEL